MNPKNAPMLMTIRLTTITSSGRLNQSKSALKHEFAGRPAGVGDDNRVGGPAVGEVAAPSRRQCRVVGGESDREGIRGVDRPGERGIGVGDGGKAAITR
jgi:hypothetical protein